MKLFLSLLTALLPLFLDAQSHYDVLFDTDEFVLTQTEKDRLTEFATRNQAWKNAISIQLTGHTDNRGSDNYNQVLSERRAQTVKSALIALQIPADKIRIDFKGESSPLNENKSTAEMTANRRVRIEWEIPEIEVVNIEESLGDIRELYKLLEQKKQQFCIDSKRDTILYLEQGTIIKIPANAFRTDSRNCVNFSAKEVYRNSDMIMENLSTMSNGKLLETGGMVYTEARDQNGNELSLNSGKELTIYLPTDNPRNDMSLFYGERDPHSQAMNWQLGPRGERIPWINIAPCLDWTPQLIYCNRCPIFFCRLFGRFDETMKGAVNKQQRSDNVSFRKCQRRLRKNQLTSLSINTWYFCDSLFRDLSPEDIQAYQDSIRARMERRRQENIKNLETNISEGNVNSTTLSYYVADVARLGWMNCDAFSGIAASEKLTMVVPLIKNSENDCKLLFRDRRSLMNSDNKGGKFTFSNIGKDIPVWVLALKYHSNKIFLSLKPQNTAKTGESVDFKEVSLEELKAELRKLDGN